jgi:hypothetical protein
MIGPIAINRINFGVQYLTMNKLACKFESLGTNCEIGLIQRYLGYEGLNLFKWTSIGGDKLLKVLENQIKDYDLIDDHSLVVNSSSQYDLVNHRYSTETHTFINYDASLTNQKEQLLLKMMTRQKFLIRKFLDEIKENDKIYTFKSVKTLHPSNVLKIREALLNLGSSKLFIVQPLEDLKENEFHFEIKDQIAFGFIGGSVFSPDYVNWPLLLKVAHSHFFGSSLN